MNNMGEQSLANLHSRENLQIWLVRSEGCPPVGSVVVGGSREFFNSESFSDAKCPFLTVMGLRSFFFFFSFPICSPKEKLPLFPVPYRWLDKDEGGLRKTELAPQGERVAFLGTWQRSATCSAAQCLFAGAQFVHAGGFCLGVWHSPFFSLSMC